jgi:aminopeptidase N
MIRGVMGKTNFDAAVISYVAENKLSNTKHQDLLENFDRKPNGNDMSLHMKEWIEKNGYPVLTLERDYSGSNDISYKQQRFLLPVGAAGSITNASMDTIWHIPLTMTDGYPAGPLPNPDDLKKCWLTQKSG